MDGFETNKIMAAILVALLTGMVASIVADSLIEPKFLDKNVYVIEGVGQTVAAGAATGPSIEPVEPLLASADIERGKKISKKCMQCHTMQKGQPSPIGPNLYGIVGTKAAQVAGFAYSKAMVAFAGSWDFNALNEYLYKPQGLVKGTKMVFPGLKKVKDRADMIAYLNTLSDNPLPLPSPDAVVETAAAEGAEVPVAAEATEEAAAAAVASGDGQQPAAAAAE
ncbi:MAG: c-type cytochrome [Alphaproteobacteria bacterium]